MAAAQFNSMETVTVLLDLGANPNYLDHHQQPALYHALVTEVTPVILKLLNVTTNGLKASINALASTKSIGFSEEIFTFVKEKTQHNSELFIHSLQAGFKFGNIDLLNLLLGRTDGNRMIQLWNTGSFLKDKLISSMPLFLDNAIISDNPEACKIVKQLCQHVNFEIEERWIKLAKERLQRKVIDNFEKVLEGKDDLIKNNLAENVSKFTGSIDAKSELLLDLIPKSEEFPYYDELAKVKKMLPDSLV